MNRGTLNERTATIRPYEERDETAVVGVWYASGRAVYSFLPDWQSLTLERATQAFREIIRPRCDIWVGVDTERIVAFLAINGSYIDRIYVDPPEWRNGWGTRLIVFAKTLSPHRLELCTHQENDLARKFYEKHGFRAVRFGISPPPESAPDVEFHWRPEYDIKSD